MQLFAADGTTTILAASYREEAAAREEARDKTARRPYPYFVAEVYRSDGIDLALVARYGSGREL